MENKIYYKDQMLGGMMSAEATILLDMIEIINKMVTIENEEGATNIRRIKQLNNIETQNEMIQ